MKTKSVFKMVYPDEPWHEWVKIEYCPEKLAAQNKNEGSSWRHLIHCACGYTALSNNNKSAKARIGQEPAYPGCSNHDLTTWAGFGLLWEQAQEMKWFESFIAYMGTLDGWSLQHNEMYNLPAYYINPQRFLDVLYEFGKATGRIKG